MTQSARPQGKPPAAGAEKQRARRPLAPLLVIVAEAGGFVTLTALLLSGHFIEAMWALQFVLAAGMLLAVLWAGARRRRVWSEPLARLEALLPEIRDGREPIESLSRIDGRIASLAVQIQSLLRDLRRERARAAKLQDEMRQRVASRTEVLERTIGALRQQAARDPLTGLFNRRMLDAYLPESVERCRSAGKPLCVLMIDIDDFKPLNDTLGHAAGDEMLRSIAQIIRSTIRDGDIAFRCGGDEFLIVLEGYDAAAGRALAGRLSSLADALGKTVRVARPPRLSIGISSLADLHEPTAQALLHRADQELYQMKAEHHAANRPTPVRQSA